MKIGQTVLFDLGNAWATERHESEPGDDTLTGKDIQRIEQELIDMKVE